MSLKSPAGFYISFPVCLWCPYGRQLDYGGKPPCIVTHTDKFLCVVVDKSNKTLLTTENSKRITVLHTIHRTRRVKECSFLLMQFCSPCLFKHFQFWPNVFSVGTQKVTVSVENGILKKKCLKCQEEFLTQEALKFHTVVSIASLSADRH